MMDTAHAGFILAAYLIAALVVAAMIVHAMLDYRRLRRALAKFTNDGAA